MSDQRYDHYYYVQTRKDFTEGHIFCTQREAEEIEAEIKALLPKATVSVDFGGEYDYTTEDGTHTTTIAVSIAGEFDS